MNESLFSKLYSYLERENKSNRKIEKRQSKIF